MADAGGAGRRITVSSVSCRGVKSFVPFQKPPLFAAVSLGGRREKTPADPDGGENPDWDGAVFAFDVDGLFEGDAGLLRFEVKAQVPLLGTKLVGTTCVPLSHLGGDGGAPRRVSYQALAPDGKPNGSLSFVYAVTGGGAYQQPQIYGAPEQGLGSCCPPPLPPSNSAYPAPATASFAPHGSSYPPPVSAASLYPSLQDFLPPSSYPPPPQMTGSPFPASNFGPNSSYPPPPAQATVYPPPPPAQATVYPPPPPAQATVYPPPPPPPSCTACPAPPAQYISSYPPPPPSYYPPPPPSGYPPPASSYPPPPESGSQFPVLPQRSFDRGLPYMTPMFQDSAITYPPPPAPSAGSYYPPPETRHREGGASSPYYYPQPGTRYS